MSARRTRAIALKELRHIVRDKRSLGMALAMPLLMILLFGYALSLDVDRVPTLIYDSDRTEASRELIERFRGSRYFDIRGFTDNYADIERGIDKSEVLMAVVIPADYSRNLRSGHEADVQIILDGSDSNTASIALGYAETLVRSFSFEVRRREQARRLGREMEPPLDPRLRVLFNSSMESKNYVVPGLIAVILMIISALLTSLTIAREWEMGTMEQLLSTPVRPAELVLGKMLAYSVVGFADMALAIGVGLAVFHVPLRGSPLLLFLTSSLFLFGALFWGILLSAVARTQVLAFEMGILSSFLPAFLLSGFVYAVENMPHVIQMVTYLVPARYFVTILKGIFLKGVGVQILWAEILFLGVYTLLVFLLATRKLSQKLA
jgi:ABC-2 type transport system permease protein